MAIDFKEDASGGIDFREDAPAPTGQSLSSMESGHGPELAGVGPTPIDFQKNILTNEPTGFLGNVARGTPAAVGGMLGGAVGSALGPAGTIAGYGLGAAGAEGGREILAQLFAAWNGKNGPTGKEALGNMAVQGVANAAGAGIGEAASSLGGLAKTVVAGQMRVGPNIKTAIGEAVLNDPGILARARTPGQMSALYHTFEDANGLVSPTMARAVAGDIIMDPGGATKTVNDIYTRLTNPRTDLPTSQELYNASQSARFLRDQAKFSNTGQAANLGNIMKAKGAIDSALEEATKDAGMSYGALRRANFESKVGQTFSSPYPQNVNGEPNVLRSLMATQTGGASGAALGASFAGLPGAVVAAPLGAALGYASVSPMVYGAAIKATAAMQPIARAAAAGVKFAPGSIGAYYSSPGISH